LTQVQFNTALLQHRTKYLCTNERLDADDNCKVKSAVQRVAEEEEGNYGIADIF
jgi:hypothetical protein